MIYSVVKLVHLICVVISLSGFLARGVGHLMGANWMSLKWAKVLPHVVDTLLLVSGVGLIMITHQYPGETLWISVKLGLVLIYILLGVVAFRLSRNRVQMICAWVAALAIVMLILMIAGTHQVPDFMGLN